MIAAALLDLTGDADGLKRVLDALPVQAQIDISETQKHGIRALTFHVDAPCEHAHRHPEDIDRIIDGAPLAGAAKTFGHRVVDILARAEAAVHGIAPAEVHFHEVGAIDSIIDIVAAAYLLEQIAPQRVISTPLGEGTGFVDCQHGRLPVPVPAVAQLAKTHQIPLRLTDTRGEMVTPTGIAVLAALNPEFTPPTLHNITAGGTGAGRKDFDHANILRAVVFEILSPPAPFSEKGAAKEDEVVELVAAIDDSTPEELGRLMEILLKAGALDVYYTPVFMKKNRPGAELTALCNIKREEEFTRLIFRHSSSIGLRCRQSRRRVMERSVYQAQTEFGSVEVKRCTYGDITKYAAEYESARAASQKYGVSLREVYREAQTQFAINNYKDERHESVWGIDKSRSSGVAEKRADGV
jgi:uncharacterized protein (TIGR00299 family) protein